LCDVGSSCLAFMELFVPSRLAGRETVGPAWLIRSIWPRTEALEARSPKERNTRNLKQPVIFELNSQLRNESRPVKTWAFEQA